ncbi:hypothetical protein Slin14017_G126510 [Septoria linicola]|nr:hypothetical protein Slin14017_G126510 [Septoria linicola]
MQTITGITSILALAISALAVPTTNPEAATLDTRAAASKLNQYSNLNCLDNSGGNTPTYHASPPARKCYNIDPTTKSFYWGQGPLTQVWAYSKAGCTGLSTNLAGGDNCVAVNINTSDEFQNILSIMMD